MPDSISPKPPGISAPLLPGRKPRNVVDGEGTDWADAGVGARAGALAGALADAAALADAGAGAWAGSDAWGGQRFGAGRLAPRQRPLPDAVAIRSIVVPPSAPRYDDDLPGLGPSGRAVVAPAELTSAATPVGPAATGQATHSGPAPAQAPGPAPLTRSEGESGLRPLARDPAGHWPSQFAQVLAETLAGSRPPSQIASWTTDQARRRISQLGPLMAAAYRPRVRRVLVTSPAGGVLEMAVVVGLGTQVRALAVRLERIQPAEHARPVDAINPVAEAGWVCTAIEAA